ncbi:MAG: metal-dependent hydrolase [Candidatus Wallbacteria bacterium]|nr:metal-dependent hydrolase [Candidatus Wallbacteria bacterium]
MKITFHGHACILIEGSRKVIFDPFLNGNPSAVIKADDLSAIDYILVTHDHMDHLGDSEIISKKTGATVVAIHELSVVFQEKGLKSEGMNIGGTIELPGIKVHMVNAVHSGGATGLILELDGKMLYHSGDTALFSDMELYGEFFSIDMAFLPIGDRYTMGPASAARAVELLRVPKVVPIHHSTFPLLTGRPEDFRKLVKTAEVIVLSPGQSCEL